jgi:hypothetical protein
MAAAQLAQASELKHQREKEGREREMNAECKSGRGRGLL